MGVASRRMFLYGAGVAAGVLAAWRLWPATPEGPGRVTTDEIGDQVQTLPRGQLPVFARTDDERALYRYAVEHGDELRYLPCFCGCGRFGHGSNRDCYVKAVHADGRITFTSHAAT